MLNEKEEEKTQKFLSKLPPSKASDYSIWKCTKAQNQQNQRIPPIKDCNDKLAKTSLAKANTFGHNFSKVFNPFPSQNAAHYDEVLEFIESPGQLDLLITPFTQT